MKDTWAKAKLKTKGWSYRRAAPVLGVTYQYLCDVCNGVHQSIRLNSKIFDLPSYSEFLRANPTYFTNRRRAHRRPKNLSTKPDEK